MKLFYLFRLISFICMGAAALPLYAAIYKLDDHVNRVTIYSNMPIRPAPVKTDVSKPLPTTPTAPITPTTPTREPGAPVPQPPPASATVSAKPTSSAMNDYPRISSAVQKTRDNERLAILNHELHLEETALADAVSRNVAGDIIRRYKANIEALKREIGYGK